MTKKLKYYDKIDQVIKIDSQVKQFDMFDTAFSVNVLDLAGIKPLPIDHILKINGLQGLRYDSDDETKGKTRLDYALASGAGGLEDAANVSRVHSDDSGYILKLENNEIFQLSMYRQSNPLNNRLGPQIDDDKYLFESRSVATESVKKAAKLYGADLVGIAPFDERFLYNSEVYIPRDFYTGDIAKEYVDISRKVEFGFEPKSVIVLAYEMDYESYMTQPSEIGAAATTIGYSRMIENSLKVATFIRSLGYNAHHSGNGTGLSVPTAIQAGLGENSRMGLLITEEYGPRVRIAKVYTDLELDVDKIKTFGVREFCEICKKCSRICPSKAISTVSKMSDSDNIQCNKSNALGVEKWFNDGQKCLNFWGENRTECGACIAGCAYNR